MNYIKGIDVSKWQRIVDWQAVKNSGIGFAIIRAGYGMGNIDPYFVENITNAKKVGLNCGVYWYSYAKSINEAKQEARYFINTIKKYKFEYPIVMDIEDNSLKSLGRQTLTDIVKAFLNTLQDAEYYPMIYANKYWFTNILDDSQLSKYPHWVAQYASKCAYTGSYGIWQYSSTGSVNGISGNVDMNYCYIDYPTIIKDKGLNGFKGKDDKMERLIIAYGDGDVPTATIAMTKFQCGMITREIFEANKTNNISKVYYVIGGPENYNPGISGATVYHLSGADRVQTALKALA